MTTFLRATLGLFVMQFVHWSLFLLSSLVGLGRSVPSTQSPPLQPPYHTNATSDAKTRPRSLYYRSRFHPDYFGQADLREFLRVYYLGREPEIPRQKIEWGLSLLEVGLPYSLPPDTVLEMQEVLSEAHKIRRQPDFFSSMHTDPEVAELLWSPTYSRRYANAVLAGVTGYGKELAKEEAPMDAGDEDTLDEGREGGTMTIFSEPAWDVLLHAAHQRVASLYKDAPRDSHLFSTIHKEQYLSRLLKVMKSPDSRDGDSIAEVLTATGVRLLRNLGMTPSDQVSMDALTGLYGALCSFLETTLSRPTSARFRALPYVMQVAKELLAGSSGSQYQEPFWALIIQKVAPFFVHSEYHRYHVALNGYLGDVFSLAKETSPHHWDVLCAMLIDGSFPQKAVRGERDENDVQRLAFILNLFATGRISLDHHIFLFKRLIRHVRKRSTLLTQSMVLHTLTHDSFVRLFSKHSMLYRCSDHRRLVFKTLLVQLANWYLKVDKPTPPSPSAHRTSIRDTFKRLLDLLFATPEASRLLLKDTELQELQVAVQKPSPAHKGRVPPLTIPPIDSNPSTPRRHRRRRDSPQLTGTTSQRIPTRRGKSSSLGSLLDSPPGGSSPRRPTSARTREALQGRGDHSGLVEQVGALSLSRDKARRHIREGRHIDSPLPQLTRTRE